MNNSDRFKPVLRVAENREAKAARQFGLSKKHKNEEEEKLDNLRQYHAEYMVRYQTAASAGMTANQLCEYQAFLSKLDIAISEQEVIVKQSQLTCTQEKQKWTQKHIRTQAMDKAMGRMMDSEQKEMEAAEQKASDEVSQRIIRPPHTQH